MNHSLDFNMTLLLSTLIPILCAIFIFGGLGYFLWKNRRRNGYDLPQPESPHHFHTYKRLVGSLSSSIKTSFQRTFWFAEKQLFNGISEKQNNIEHCVKFC